VIQLPKNIELVDFAQVTLDTLLFWWHGRVFDTRWNPHPTSRSICYDLACARPVPTTQNAPKKLSPDQGRTPNARGGPTKN